MSEQEARWTYPLGEHEGERITSRTGRPLSELTLEHVRAGTVDAQDFTIHAETLRAQADIAERAGFGQLAANLRRAAELTIVPDAKVLAVYEALRPYRVRAEELLGLAAELEQEYGAVENARLLRQAAEVYQKRGLI